jgi:HEPN domain-containing protein
MTTTNLALHYMVMAEQRLQVLPEYLKIQAWATVVREAQEIVELASKAMLRSVGIEPPKWHDVGVILLREQQRFPRSVQLRLPELTSLSASLREDRERSFYGDDDQSPLELYDEKKAVAAAEGASMAVDVAKMILR